MQLSYKIYHIHIKEFDSLVNKWNALNDEIIEGSTLSGLKGASSCAVLTLMLG